MLLKIQRNNKLKYVISDDIYIAELMVESNVTLDAQTILSILSSTTNLQVNDAQGVTYTVTLLQNELVAGTVQHFLISVVISD